ncbi:restriction endonuclease subunit S [Ruania halotolerans]|uniref:restriction endonuclease subunit S n=1 Tax=Ruania halotolerans TaxID=2897773 RepID=UPI001E576454|nr:restriction endonuclease subunit S [Ruania halotolerans]UFU07947.1 restriction endonuclease subunit S [Ruania halotolerans]
MSAATVRLADVTTRIGSGITPRGGSAVYTPSGRPFLRSQNVGWGDLRLDDMAYIDEATHSTFPATELRTGDILLNITGASIGRSAVATPELDGGNVNQHVCEIRLRPGRMDPHFVNAFLLSRAGQDQIDMFQAGGNRQGLNFQQVGSISVPDLEIGQQRAVGGAGRDADNGIAGLERMIAKKQAIKQGMMQQLLTGTTRVPGFTVPWRDVTLGDATDILDNLRMPLSGAQRANRSGPFPYCGANGVLDHIDDYMMDDDVVLLAEDGGNFDQWRTRPIAYRMKGKIWVNNHAHVLKATQPGDTGFLFYSLQHKDITPFISSGTRSKLTRGELVRIKVSMPDEADEQRAIAEVLGDADREIGLLRQRLRKARSVKAGMMQELLTGRTRLPIDEGAA